MKLFSLAAGLCALLFTALLLPATASQAAPTFIYSSPRPGAALVSPGTTITVRYAQDVDPDVSAAAFDVRGEESGAHAGDVTLAGDGRTVIFTPHTPFVRGERVTASIDALQTTGGSPLEGGELAFTISPRAVRLDAEGHPPSLQPHLDEAAAAAHPLTPSEPMTAPVKYVTAPSLPPISVTVPASNTGDGYVFLANFSIGGRAFENPDQRPHLLIVDNEGEPVFFRRLVGGGAAYDFKKQPNGVLSYARTATGFHILDETYKEVDVYNAGNGYVADIHDFQLRPDGHALLMIYDAQIVDMSEIVEGGDPDALVFGLVIQEVDADNNVLFQWRSWDHIPITDTTQDVTSSRIDYVHGNSVDWDNDGNIIISSRYLDEVTKIDRQTGDVIWRLGGKGNQFTFIGDGEPFFDQHDARRLENGHLTLFDNRSAQDSTYSRGVEYELDEDAMTATRVWEHRSDGDVASFAMGNTQRLPNGNSMIGWGAFIPTLTEVTPDGEKAFELMVGPYDDPDVFGVTYRAFRFPWEGAPTTRPRVEARTEMTETAVYYSWNGATAVDAWRLYGGPTRDDLSEIETKARDGFETRSAVAETDLCFFQVEALDAEGAVLASSAVDLAEHCVVGRAMLPFVTP